MAAAIAVSPVACVAAAAPPGPEAPQQVLGGLSGAPVDLSPVAWKPGLSSHDLSVAGQGTRSVLVWVPPERAAPRALVVLLHGRTGPGAAHGKDAHAPARALVNCLAAPALGSLDPILIAPISTTGEWWQRSETEFVLGLVLAVRSRWPEAGSRGVIAGYSNGGIGSWYFARLYPEYFRAAIPMAFNHTIVGKSPLPIYAIAGTRDEQFDFHRVRDAVQQLRGQGGDVILDQKYRGSHFAPCSYVPELMRAGQWLEQHVFSASASGPRP
jgi:poly(3-hydroxybutyrate) depolymerase